ncbi:OmpA family protein [Hydrogenimonas sp.]
MRKQIVQGLLALFLAGPLLAGGLVTGSAKMKFEPGDKVLYETDFKECPVGEFPEGFDKFEKAVECVKYDDHIWIAPATKNGMRLWKKLEIGKKPFSFEYDLLVNPEAKKGIYPKLRLRLLTRGRREKEWNEEEYFGDQPYDVKFYGDRIEVPKVGRVMEIRDNRRKRLHMAIQVRRHQFRLFVDGKRLLSIPFQAENGVHGFEFALWESPAYGILVSNIRIAEYTKKEAKPTPEKLGIGVEKTAEGYKVTVPEKVLFDFGKFILKPEAKEALAAAGDVVRQKRPKKIVVTGYTDNVGSDAYNLKLSLQRAQSVADYLIYCEKLDPGLFTIEGRGKADPIADNATEAGRAKNRRVELRLVE